MEKKKMAKKTSKLGIDGLVKDLEKAFGRGILMPLDGDAVCEEAVIPTGSLPLDRALGIGGLPRGRIVEIYGPEAGGKTTLALALVAEAQRLGGLCAVIDAEHALNLDYMGAMGCDLSRLLVSQPDYGEQALEVVDALVRSGEVDVIVVDSVAALTPKAEIEGEMGDISVGLHARLMSRAMRKLTAQVSKTGTTLVFINQTRQKIGVTFGSPETTTGGNALKFYASVRLKIRRIGSLKRKGEIYGNRVKIKVVKNKMAPPFKEVETDLYFGRGFSRGADVLDMALDEGLVQRSGAFFKFGDSTLGQGREAAIKALAKADGLGSQLEGRLFASDTDVSPSNGAAT